MLQIGDRVLVHGLIRSENMNGKFGRIVERVEDRFAIEFDDGARARIKPDNLKRVVRDLFSYAFWIVLSVSTLGSESSVVETLVGVCTASRKSLLHLGMDSSMGLRLSVIVLAHPC